MRKQKIAAVMTIILLICQTSFSQEPSSDSNANEATLAPPPPPPAPHCFPDCREGFICHDGTCISACNPPCAEGTRCTSGGECVSVNGPVAIAQDSRIAKKEAIRKNRRELRAQYRTIPRFSFGAAMMVTLMPVDHTNEVVVGLLPNIGLGMRINMKEKFGFWVKGGPIAGVYMLSASGTGAYDDTQSAGSHSDATFVSGGFAETGIYAGPFGRFTVGPVIGILVTNPYDTTLEVESNGDAVTYAAREDVWGLYGLDVSLLLGTKEVLHLYVRLMSGIPTKEMPMYAGAGIAFDLPVAKPKMP